MHTLPVDRPVVLSAVHLLHSLVAPKKSFHAQVAVGCGIDHSNRHQTRTVVVGAHLDISTFNAITRVATRLLPTC